MGLMENVVGLLLNIAVLSSLSGHYFTSPAFAYPSRDDTWRRPQNRRPRIDEVLSPRQRQFSKQPEQITAIVKQDRVKTVTVTCYPDFVDIIVKADMFELGTFIDGEDLRLGVENRDSCKATVFSADEYRIFAALSDCGIKRWMTEDSLVYTNLLIYSPMASQDGVIRMEDAVIPIECHYSRKYSLTSASLQPTWIPFTSTQSAEEKLIFSLRIMTSDWLYERGSSVYFLGDPISIEASVRVAHHMRLRVFVKNCVATLDPDRNSLPRYVFIENDGCLVDSQLAGSRSQFMPRTQDHKLQFHIDAFRFYQEDRGQLFITCHLAAVPVMDDAEPHNKACSFIDGRWRSNDGNDLLCGNCQSQPGVDQATSHPSPRRMPTHDHPSKPQTHWRSGMNTKKGWEKETTVGPMLVLTTKQKSVPLSPRGKGGIPAFLSRPEVWRPTSPGSLESSLDFKNGPFSPSQGQMGGPSSEDSIPGGPWLFPTPEPRGLGEEFTTGGEGLTQDREELMRNMARWKSGVYEKEWENEVDVTEDAVAASPTNQTLSITLQPSEKSGSPDGVPEHDHATAPLSGISPTPPTQGNNGTDVDVTATVPMNTKDADTVAPSKKQDDPIKR